MVTKAGQTSLIINCNIYLSYNGDVMFTSLRELIVSLRELILSLRELIVRLRQLIASLRQLIVLTAVTQYLLMLILYLDLRACVWVYWHLQFGFDSTDISRGGFKLRSMVVLSII